ncbi:MULTISPECIES: hypothetical protein [Capnocytophaga]|uniref:hypothetical protein n=1 Tax=Capnocytophaga TaxID=1016 RepID=UPI001562396F|nr:hypothetical protein [Capnocytophaga canimorsus]
MSEEYKKSGIITDIIIGLFFLCFLLFLTIMIVRSIIIDADYENEGKLIMSFLFILLWSGITYTYLKIPLVRYKYYKHNLEQETKINTLEKKIIIIHKKDNKREEIGFEQVHSVELYYSWNTTSFSSDLGYSQLNLKNGRKIIITQNRIDQYHIYRTFKDKKPKTIEKYFNEFTK